ncbi:MAG: hypothetical protein A4E35_00128 [Methanoregula sp. PtaU1.Bin051]|nr:MAG: hypothetical protein A4E35_00128 [Methanoregula sp. PtaU1.Bin051]
MVWIKAVNKEEWVLADRITTIQFKTPDEDSDLVQVWTQDVLILEKNLCEKTNRPIRRKNEKNLTTPNRIAFQDDCIEWDASFKENYDKLVEYVLKKIHSSIEKIDLMKDPSTPSFQLKK